MADARQLRQETPTINNAWQPDELTTNPDILTYKAQSTERASALSERAGA